jgi:hypothetical protein
MFRFAWPQYAFCFALPCSFLYTWRGWWRGYPAFYGGEFVTGNEIPRILAHRCVIAAARQQPR